MLRYDSTPTTTPLLPKDKYITPFSLKLKSMYRVGLMTLMLVKRKGRMVWAKITLTTHSEVPNCCSKLFPLGTVIQVILTTKFCSLKKVFSLCAYREWVFSHVFSWFVQFLLKKIKYWDSLGWKYREKRHTENPTILPTPSNKTHLGWGARLTFPLIFPRNSEYFFNFPLLFL